MPAGESRQFATWRYPASPLAQSKWQAADSARRNLVATACFCSVLGECWTSNLCADVPKPVAACNARGRVNYTG